MATFRQILYATDFSEAGAHALRHAAYLARQHRATLHVVHAEEVSDPYYEADAGLRARLREEMDALVAGLDTEGLELRTAIAHGEAAAPAVCHYAEQHGVDLIVVGTHGRRGWRRVLIGSVASEIVRGAPCPVYAVRTTPDHPPDRLVDHVLAPVDLSDVSPLATRYARALAADYGARLTLLYVVQDLDLPPGIYDDIENPLLRAFPDVKERALARMQEMFDAAGGPEVEGRFEVEAGSPSEAVTHFATRRGVDLVVIGSHRRKRLDRLILGSVAEKLIQAAPCPVFVVKPTFEA